MKSPVARLVRAIAIATTALLTLTACAAPAANDVVETIVDTETVIEEATAQTPEAAAATELGPDDLGGENNPIRIGVVDAEEPFRTRFQELAEAEGIHIEYVNFADFQLPNQALAQGDLDLNQFQHLQFLANFNEATGNELTPIGATAVFPLGLYSMRWNTLDEFPDGAEIAIPDDPTNQARALLVLQDAGLLTLRDGGNSFSTPFDIIPEESRVSVLPVDAAQTAISLPDVDGSVVNNSMIVNVGMTLDDAIFADDPDSDAAEPYINVWAARPEDVDNPTFGRLVELFQTNDEVVNGLLEANAHAAAIRTNPASDLQRIMTEIQENLRNQ